MHASKTTIETPPTYENTKPKSTHELQKFQAAIHFQPLQQPASAGISYEVLVLQITHHTKQTLATQNQS
jgi:hypothetical protein